jgi:hypothetical protein
MAMKKAEMVSRCGLYNAAMADARVAEEVGLFGRAVQLALSACDFVDGMMQYERRFEDREFDSVEAIDLVLKYAPVLLDYKSLDAIERLLKTQRRIERDTSADVGEQLAGARRLLWDAHRMWDRLEYAGDTRQDELQELLGGSQARWRSIAEAWEKMGLVRRTPEGRSYRLSLLTRMGEVVPGKCPACGKVAEAPKAMFLEVTGCCACGQKVGFVLLAQKA